MYLNQQHAKLGELEYLMEEISELVQHAKDLNDNRRLMIEDLKLIKASCNPRMNSLYTDYFRHPF